MAFEAQVVEVSGAKIALRRAGRGAPLLFLHGTDGLAEWPHMLDVLSEQYDVIVPDLPGFGRSALPDDVDEVSDLAYFFMGLMEALDLRDVRIVAHSLGAWVALEMAVRSAERLHSLALIAAAGIHVKGSPKADIYMIDPDEQARLAYADATMGEAAAQRALAGKYQEQAILSRIASARFGWNPRLYNPRLERWLHRVKLPVQIVWGDRDRIIPPVYAEAFGRLLPRAEVVLLHETGHLPHVEREAEVMRTLHPFLAR